MKDYYTDKKRSILWIFVCENLFCENVFDTWNICNIPNCVGIRDIEFSDKNSIHLKF